MIEARLRTASARSVPDDPLQRIVFGVALTVTGDADLAEDVTQLGFERAWRSVALYDSRRASVRTWLLAIVHNLAVDVVRAPAPAPVDPQHLQH